MNKKILAGLVIASLSSPIFADDNTSNHNATVTVPSVALVAVDTTAAAISVVAPDDAGSNFDMSSATATSSYAITSNIAADQSTVTSRTLTAEIDAIDPAFTLTANVTAPADAAAVANVALAVDGTGDGAAVVTGIKNVAQSGLGITYALGLADPAVVPAHGTHTINVAYTLGSEQ